MKQQALDYLTRRVQANMLNVSDLAIEASIYRFERRISGGTTGADDCKKFGTAHMCECDKCVLGSAAGKNHPDVEVPTELLIHGSLRCALHDFEGSILPKDNKVIGMERNRTILEALLGKGMFKEDIEL